MRFYKAVMHKDQGSAYGLTFVDLPGCHAAADSWGAIQTQAVKAISLWLEDNDPEGVSVSDLNQAYEDMEMKDGAIIALIPYPS